MTCHLLVQRLRMSVTVPLLPHVPLWHVQELHLYCINHVCIVVEGHVLSPSGQQLHIFSTINISIVPMLKPGH
jgi:pyridoxal biosynthesis lyase PdxS